MPKKWMRSLVMRVVGKVAEGLLVLLQDCTYLCRIASACAATGLQGEAVVRIASFGAASPSLASSLHFPHLSHCYIGRGNHMQSTKPTEAQLSINRQIPN